MFIKIKSVSGELMGQQTVYDAKKYHLRPSTIEEDPELSTCMIDIHIGEKETRTFAIDCRHQEVFIMNNEGVTVDRISW